MIRINFAMHKLLISLSIGGIKCVVFGVGTKWAVNTDFNAN